MFGERKGVANVPLAGLLRCKTARQRSSSRMVFPDFHSVISIFLQHYKQEWGSNSIRFLRSNFQVPEIGPGNPFPQGIFHRNITSFNQQTFYAFTFLPFTPSIFTCYYNSNFNEIIKFAL